MSFVDTFKHFFRPQIHVYDYPDYERRSALGCKRQFHCFTMMRQKVSESAAESAPVPEGSLYRTIYFENKVFSI